MSVQYLTSLEENSMMHNNNNIKNNSCESQVDGTQLENSKSTPLAVSMQLCCALCSIQRYNNQQKECVIMIRTYDDESHSTEITEMNDNSDDNYTLL